MLNTILLLLLDMCSKEYEHFRAKVFPVKVESRVKREASKEDIMIFTRALLDRDIANEERNTDILIDILDSVNLDIREFNLSL